MVIKPNKDWGEVVTNPDFTRFDSESKLASTVLESLENGKVVRASLTTGDLLKSVGDTHSKGSERLVLPMDLCLAKTETGQEIPFISHLVMRNTFWSGEFLVAMNTSWLGSMYLGPKAHPNDGLLDITIGRLDLRQRLKARKLSSSASHLPHPGLRYIRKSEYTYEPMTSQKIFADDTQIVKGKTLILRVIPDAFELIV